MAWGATNRVSPQHSLVQIRGILMRHKRTIKLVIASALTLALASPLAALPSTAQPTPGPDVFAQHVIEQHNREVARQVQLHSKGRATSTNSQPVTNAMVSNVRQDRSRNLKGLAISWFVVPTTDAFPGTLWDPDPMTVQDWGLNSSLLVQVTRDGQPVKGVSVIWSASDSTAKVKAGMPTTDTDGTARAWYWVGSGKSQTITAKISGTNTSISTFVSPVAASDYQGVNSVNLSLHSQLDPTTMTSSQVTVTPKSDNIWDSYVLANYNPQLIGNVYNGGGFSAQLAAFDCYGYSDNSPSAICNDRRGRLNGHAATIAVFPFFDGDRVTDSPSVVWISPLASCYQWPNDAGANTAYCEFKSDWRVGQSFTYQVENIDGAAAGFQRLRVSTVDKTGTRTALAIIDAPFNLDYSNASLSADLSSASIDTCLAQLTSGMVVNKVQVLASGVWTDVSSGMGFINNWYSHSCANYQITNTDEGLLLSTGGNQWMDIEPVLHFDWMSSQLHFGKGYYFDWEPTYQNQAVSLVRKD